MYEYFITLGREAELFWKGKWTGAAILFYVNRYLSLIVNIYGLASNAQISAQVRGTLGGRVFISLNLCSTWFEEVCLHHDLDMEVR